MAKTPEAATAFLHDLRLYLVQGAEKEIAHLKEIKAADLKARGLEASNDGNYYLWDHHFYNRLMAEQEFSADKQTITEYFPLQLIVEGMLGIIEEIFGFVFVEMQYRDRVRLSSMWPSTTSFSHFNSRQRTAKMTLHGTEMLRSLVFGMTRMRAALSLVTYTSIYILAKVNMIMRPTSHYSQATFPLTERVNTLPLHLSVTSLNRLLLSLHY
jgi:hypothetical protein